MAVSSSKDSSAHVVSTITPDVDVTWSLTSQCTLPSPLVNRQDLVVALSQAFAADPIFSLKLIGLESALHAWLNSEEELDPINSSSMFFVLFQGRASTDCHEHTRSEIAKESRLRACAHCSVSERHKL